MNNELPIYLSTLCFTKEVANRVRNLPVDIRRKKLNIIMTTQERINVLESEILANKAYLDNTDYHVLKYAEGGKAVDEEILAGRTSARAKINENEALLVGLYEQLENERNQIINTLN